MKRPLNIIVSALALLTMTVFFLNISAHASHGENKTTAADAASAADQSTMEDFVLHAKQHIVNAVNEGADEVSVFFRQLRAEGDWKSDSVYLIVLHRNGTVITHGEHTSSLYGDSLEDIPTVKYFLENLKDADSKPVCTKYDGPDGGSEKWSCAVLYKTIFGRTNVLIGGFDHAPDADGITPLSCVVFNPAVTAEDVAASQYVSESRAQETLKDFVRGAIQRIKDIQEHQSQQTATGGTMDTIRKAACLGRGAWKSGPIYLFIMSKPETGGAPVIILNGNNPEFTGFPFENVFDEDGVDVGAEILKVAGEHGEGGFVKYKWDNPVIDEDDAGVESQSDMSPGRSPKISYVEAVKFPGNPSILIFGSGIYGTLEEDMGGGDDGGCAVAGTDGGLRGVALTQFLTVLSLCCVFLFGKRSEK